MGINYFFKICEDTKIKSMPNKKALKMRAIVKIIVCFYKLKETPKLPLFPASR